MAEVSNTSAMVVSQANIVSVTTQNLIAINRNIMSCKLTSGNYAAWRAQFHNLLFGYNLLGYMDGSHPCPLENTMSSQSSLSSSSLSTSVTNHDVILEKTE